MSNHFRQIVESINVSYSTLSAASLMEIVQVSSTEMDGALEGLHSILDITRDANCPIQLVHQSFRNFLLRNQICTDPRYLSAEMKLIPSCLVVAQVLSSPVKRDICNLDNVGLGTRRWADVEYRSISHRLFHMLLRIGQFIYKAIGLSIS